MKTILKIYVFAFIELKNADFIKKNQQSNTFFLFKAELYKREREKKNLGNL